MSATNVITIDLDLTGKTKAVFTALEAIDTDDLYLIDRKAVCSQRWLGI